MSLLYKKTNPEFILGLMVVAQIGNASVLSVLLFE